MNNITIAVDNAAMTAETPITVGSQTPKKGLNGYRIVRYRDGNPDRAIIIKSSAKSRKVISVLKTLDKLFLLKYGE